jgi:hypothetical protein
MFGFDNSQNFAQQSLPPMVIIDLDGKVMNMMAKAYSPGE